MSSTFRDDLAEKILDMAEYRMGTNRIEVTLRDGRRIAGVYVAWGREVVKVDGYPSIPFDTHDVVDVANDL